MTIDIDDKTTVMHGWADEPMDAVRFAMERAHHLVESGWWVQSISHAYGPGIGLDGNPVNLYSAVVTLRGPERRVT